MNGLTVLQACVAEAALRNVQARMYGREGQVDQVVIETRKALEAIIREASSSEIAYATEQMRMLNHDWGLE